ncbi:MAG: hypothetical protein B6I38_09770 [Anaerolineaceae bacterium 4572_5.1]|nr:MAG: hypothetical protein B6I38_09770 [Anaerolineaceae bacterium 4572_5.1]
MPSKLTRRDFLRLSGLTLGSALLTSCTGGKYPFGIGDNRPNFLIILTDDQRFDTMQYMPKTQELIFDQGVTFSHGYVNSPLCGPSRANILTGMHVHNHNVTTNKSDLDVETFVEDLQSNGYFTGLVGKYINQWKGEQRPEYDYWASIFRDASRYYDPDINVNGTWQWQIPGYITDIMRDLVLDFVDEASRKLKPFFLLFALDAPHGPATPAHEDEGLYTDLPPHRPPNFNEEDISDKPETINWRPLFNDEEIEGIEEFRRKQILTLISADRAIEAIVNKLEETGELDNTVIIFLSDNGKLWGEHRLESKGAVYEESIRVPFGLRYPPLVPEPYTEDKLVGSIDIAPTLYDLANIPIPEKFDGLSLVPLLTGGEWREEMFLECWPSRGHWTAIHSGRYKYVETDDHLSEFYDLEKDPYELENMINNPEYQEIIAAMKVTLEREKIPQ